MSNVDQILATMAKFDAIAAAQAASFVGPVTDDVCAVRVGDVIAFRDRFNGNRYTGKVTGFGDGVHVGSMQMRIQAITFNGKSCNGERLNVLPEELIKILE